MSTSDAERRVAHLALAAPPRTGAEHFRTAEMHAAVATDVLLQQRRGEFDELDAEVARVRDPFDAHMRLAEFHSRQAHTLAAVTSLRVGPEATGEYAGWKELLAERAPDRAAG